MPQPKKKNKHFNRNLFFFFLFIVIAGISFYPLDQQQTYTPRAQTEPVPSPNCLGGCPIPSDTNSPTDIQTTGEAQPTDAQSINTQPSGAQSSGTQTTTGDSSIINQIIDLLKQLLQILSGGACATPTTDVSTNDTSPTGMLSANWNGGWHRGWRKWGRDKNWGLWKKWKCSESTDQQTGGATPTPEQTASPAPQTDITSAPTDEPNPTASLVPTAAASSCGNPGDVGNSLGVGKYCTKGGGQCQGTSAPYCSLDFQTGVPGICSKPCASDTDCGVGAVCSGSGLEKGCEPITCGTTPTP